MKKVGVVTPLANDEASVEAFLNAVLSAFDSLREYECTYFIVMDRFSKDRTQEIVERVAAKDPRIKLIFYKEAHGVISCHFEGMRHALAAGCEFVIEMDGGFSHPPEKMRDILHALDQEGYEFVSMSRFLEGGAQTRVPFYRKVISRGGTLLANLWLGTRFADMLGAFHGYRAHVLRALNFDAFLGVGAIYCTEMKYYVSGFRTKEIPFIYVGSTTGFKWKWVWIALKVLFLMKGNKARALRTRD